MPRPSPSDAPAAARLAPAAPAVDADEPGAAREQRGIQSVEVGGQLLRALAHQGRPMPLKDLAREAGMAPAKAHPYLVSFGKIGLVEQDKVSGRYGLGPLALQLGLMSLHQADPVRFAAPLLPGLAQATGLTVALAVWGNHGPTIVLIEESPSAVYVNMRHGTVFSIADTASGRLYAAHRPAALVRRLYEAERKAARERAGAPALPAWRDFEQALHEVRAQGLGRSDGAVVAGVSALSAPVFDHRGEMVLAITAIGSSALVDTGWQSPAADSLRRCAAEVSARLGWRAA